MKEFDVAGPLCFSGDIIAQKRRFPASTRVGDILVIHVAGGYTISMYCRHTSQLVPAVYGYSSSSSSSSSSNGNGSGGHDDDDGHNVYDDTITSSTSPTTASTTTISSKGNHNHLELVTLKRGESLDDVVRFWGGDCCGVPDK